MTLLNKLLPLLFCLCGTSVFGQIANVQQPVNIIPEPVKVQVQQGTFHLTSQVKIVVPAFFQQAEPVARLLNKGIVTPTGFDLKITRVAAKNDKTIYLVLNKIPDPQIETEGYTMNVKPSRIDIRANQPAGLFYGIQTLFQLLPPEIEMKSKVTGQNWDIACVKIIDYPRFKWRGLMLDVSRHFFCKEFIKNYIDEMVKYKFNSFHWHLTDNHGWRIEIKGLPQLTDVGAWRVPRTGRRGSFGPPEPGEKATDGGYYAQQDIQEIVRYAQERFITILPEIDVPAHSLALIASYRNLSCTKEQYSVNPLKKFTQREDEILCVANDSTWQILDKIFTQVASLFPGPYIHTGGDEAYKGYWKDCPKDQALMKAQGITTLEGLQSYFEKKLEKIIVSKGKKMIGWDEILEGGLAPEATVMSWRGKEGGIQAAKMGHQVIMSPHFEAYLDLYQGDPVIEPFTYGKCRLKTCYEFDPLPEGGDAKYILGGQGNLWTEAVPTERHAEYMTWPRGLALSESFWSLKDNRRWEDFIQRMEWRFKYMDAAQVKYARSAYDAIISAVKIGVGPDSLKVKLETEIPGLDIYYTFKGTDPDNFYPKYSGQVLEIPKGASEIRVITYRNGKPVGRQINFLLSSLKSRLPAEQVNH